MYEQLAEVDTGRLDQVMLTAGMNLQTPQGCTKITVAAPFPTSVHGLCVCVWGTADRNGSTGTQKSTTTSSTRSCLTDGLCWAILVKAAAAVTACEAKTLQSLGSQLRQKEALGSV